MNKTKCSGRLCAIVSGLLLACPLLAGQTQTNHSQLDTQQKSPESTAEKTKVLREIEELKKGQEEIRRQLEEVLRLLHQQANAAAGVPNVNGTIFDLGKHPIVPPGNLEISDGTGVIFPS